MPIYGVLVYLLKNKKLVFPAKNAPNSTLVNTSYSEGVIFSPIECNHIDRQLE